VDPEIVVVAPQTDGATTSAEAQAGAAVAIAEAQAGAAVEIARIDADRSVEVATIDADKDAEDIAWLRGELDGLRAQCVTLAEGLSSLESQTTAQSAQIAELTTTLAALAQSIPPPPSEPIPEPEPIVVPENAPDANPAGPRENRADGDRTPAAPARIRRHWV
jgi:hypothetical protein